MKFLFYFLLMFLLCISPVLAGDVLYVPEKIPCQDGLYVRQNIKSECNLEVEIADVSGAGGDAWSGPKLLEIRGKLADQSGKSIGTFVARRHSMGDPLGGIKGTCGILRRCSKRLGMDVAELLVDPGNGVMLGDR